MLCFKDKTFCAAKCSNMECHRQFTKEDAKAAREWWSHDPGKAPVAFSDFSEHCGAYPPKQRDAA